MAVAKAEALSTALNSDKVNLTINTDLVLMSLLKEPRRMYKIKLDCKLKLSSVDMRSKEIRGHHPQ